LIRRSSQPPYVPTSEDVTILTPDAGKKYSLIPSIFRDMGMRHIEMKSSIPTCNKLSFQGEITPVSDWVTACNNQSRWNKINFTDTKSISKRTKRQIIFSL